MDKLFSDILVVDDNESNRILIADILKNAGYPVREAENGKQALLSIEEKPPLLVILDIMMPGIDGFEVCNQLKSDKKTAEIPIIFISALGDKDSILKGFEAGGVDYITKPFQAKEVIARVGAHINLYRLQFKLKKKNEKLEHEMLKRKQIEEKLQASLNNYKQLIDGMSETVWIIDFNGNLIDVNKSAQTSLGYTKEELLSIGLYGIDNSLKREMIYELIQSIHTDKLQTFETTHKSKDGRIIPVEISSSIINWQGKKAILSIGRNISNHKNALETIQNERKLLRTLIDNLPDAIYIKDKDGRKLVANAADLKIMNCSSESEILGKTDLEIFNDENGQKGYAEDMHVIKTRKAIYNKENAYYDIDGKLHWRIISKIPLTDNYGSISGLIGLGRDITEQRESREALRKSEAIKNKMVANIGDVIVIIDNNGINRYKSPNVEKWFGWKPEELVGISTWNNIHADDLAGAKNFMDNLKSEPGKTGTIKVRYLCKNGHYKWIEFTGKNLLHDDDIKGILGNYNDISDRIKSEQELLEAKERAEESDRLKSAFLANMSHEIRTPLNCILGFSELLSEPDIDANQRNEFTQLIEISGKNLLNIINDILDISKIEAGQVQVLNSTIMVQKLVNNVHKEFEHLAKEKGIQLVVSQDIPKQTLYIESDEAKLKQVLINFVGNAIKFTEQGTIEIGFQQTNGHIKFYVKDTGIGMPVDFQKHVFERFRQNETSKTRKYGGNGLGLAISKSLVEMLGGTIGVESEEEKGSTFYFTIPN
jgi:PAS domain S-box-containing protein